MYKNLEGLKSKYKTIFDNTNHFNPEVNEILSRVLLSNMMKMKRKQMSFF